MTKDGETPTIRLMHDADGAPVPDDPAICDTPAPNPLLLTAEQSATLCGTSARTWRTWDAAGHVPQPVRIGRTVRWRFDELREWVAAGCPTRQLWEVEQS